MSGHDLINQLHEEFDRLEAHVAKLESGSQQAADPAQVEAPAVEESVTDAPAS